MLIQHPAVLSENMVSLYFFLSPQRCRISHRRQCASLLHWNLTIPPSLWPDRELRKYHCPCLALAPPPVAMYLKNEYSVFKGHPDFRPYKVSLTRILRFRVGLVGALWLSLQDYIRFVLIFSVSYAVGLGQKKCLVGFPTRHRRRFYLIRLHIMHPKICFTKFAWFFPERLN